MRRKIMQFAAILLICLIITPAGALAAGSSGTEMVRVGLFFGNTALVGSNLQNNTGYGAGYRFGYYDSDLDFVEVARTGRRTRRLPF